MKKVIAWLLALCMVFQLSGMPVFAAGEGEQKTENQKSLAPQTGGLEVEMIFSLPLENVKPADMNLNAVVNGKSGRKSAQFTMEETESLVKKASASFRDLEPGSYELTVTGSRFETYTQTVEVKAMNQQVKLNNTYRDTAIIEADRHPGVMGYGDIDGNGKIDGRDKDKLIEAVNSKSGSTAGDLNRDGEADLIDLQYFTYNYLYDAVDSNVLRSYSTEAMTPEVTAGTLVDGSRIENVLTGEGIASIRPADGDISASNPVEFTIDLQNRPDVSANGITIAPPKDSENAITGGTVTVEYMDENNMLQTKEYSISPKTSLYRTRAASAAKIHQEADGTLVIDLGTQIAVKKVTIKVTGTESKKLADIATVEFLNNMEERIPAPQMNIPSNVKAQAQNKKFTVT